ncbi:MAG: hypothetical protein U1D64_03460, partial [Bacteroidales bacterium]|nr:hypothetical protein [Bacteroidales bacterium]
AFPRYAIMRRMIDLYKGFPDKDYNKMFYEEWLVSAQKGVRTSEKKEADIQSSPAPLSTKLTGIYDRGELFGKAVVTLEDVKGSKPELFLTVGPKGWKSKLTHKNGGEYRFRMGGNEFKVTFIIDKDSGECTGLDMNFGYTENFGVWKKSSK